MFTDLLLSTIRPTEFNAMIHLRLEGLRNKSYSEPLSELAQGLNHREFCYAALNKVSRSFAVVIQHLPEELRDPVCVFYLMCRGLDTIEDDMNFLYHEKLPLLRDFHLKCFQKGWTLNNVGDSADYKTLLQNFDKVIEMFLQLDRTYQHAIADTCERMGNGMADFAEKKVESTQDYDLYCHYVAGIVGSGLSDLFCASGLENTALKNETAIANSMGLFLQKVNITRDYNEDLHGGRMFWPAEIWKQYADEISWFEENPLHPKSVACLNHLVTDALRHIPDCLTYLSMIRNEKIFRFCAIPQVMAIATLAKLYNNPDVFTSEVKIRKGLAAKMMVYTNNMRNVRSAFDEFAGKMWNRLDKSDPNYHLTKLHLLKAFDALAIDAAKNTSSVDATRISAMKSEPNPEKIQMF
jgi:farnesyl-diphosphate farnesyltransferase